jgi:hypothetical protein
MKPCAVPNCCEPTFDGKLMCLAHWRAVPKDLQFDVYRSWATFKKARQRNLQIAALRSYRNARDAAINHIKKQAEHIGA